MKAPPGGTPRSLAGGLPIYTFTIQLNQRLPFQSILHDNSYFAHLSLCAPCNSDLHSVHTQIRYTLLTSGTGGLLKGFTLHWTDLLIRLNTP